MPRSSFALPPSARPRLSLERRDSCRSNGVCLNAFLVSLGLGMTLLGPPQVQPQEVRPAPADAAAVQQFDAAIADYVAMRRRLREEIPSPVPNSSSVELNNASDALAAAIQRSRQKAGVGDLFVAPVAPVFKRNVEVAVRSPEMRKVLAAIDDEQPTVLAPKIHLRFPGASQMATMPPSLLAVLPPLPKELEYRIIGRFLVLRDVDAALIIDYLPDAIPR